MGKLHLCTGATDRVPSPSQGQSWVTSPEGLLISSTWSGWLSEETGRGWGGGEGLGKGLETCGCGGSQSRLRPQKLCCIPDWQAGSQAPVGGPRPVVEWGVVQEAPRRLFFSLSRKKSHS